MDYSYPMDYSNPTVDPNKRAMKSILRIAEMVALAKSDLKQNDFGSLTDDIYEIQLANSCAGDWGPSCLKDLTVQVNDITETLSNEVRNFYKTSNLVDVLALMRGVNETLDRIGVISHSLKEELLRCV